MVERADVVVVGAGVMGCGTAYWLSKEGCKVVVLEQEALGHGASGMSAAMIGSIVEGMPEDPVVTEPARASLKLHQELARTLPEESGIDIGYRENSTIHLAFSESDVERLKSQFLTLNRQGLSVRWLEGQSLWEVEPRVSRKALGGLASHQAQVLAYRFVLALVCAAEKRGMKMRHGEAVGLENSAGRVNGVRLRSGEIILTDKVVLAMGPWSQHAASWVGLNVPVYPVRGQLLELQVPNPQLKASLSHDGMYVVHKADGITLAGTTEEHDSGFANHPTEAGAEAIVKAVLRLAPSLGEAKVMNHISGLRPRSGDGLPLIGPLPGWQGVYMVSGHFRDGIKLSAISTRIITDLITKGCSPISIERFDPGRFGRME